MNLEFLKGPIRFFIYQMLWMLQLAPFPSNMPPPPLPLRPKTLNKPPITPLLNTYCWFSHDVTKIQTKELSILPRFYFHGALEQLKTNFHTNFHFKRVLGFVIEDAWISKFLRDAIFTWRPRELSCRLKKWLISGNFFYLNSSCIRKSITLMFMSFSRNKFMLL